jgi:hypothetical protein
MSQASIKILRRRDVQAMTGLPCSSLYAAIAAGSFPKPIPLGRRVVNKRLKRKTKPVEEATSFRTWDDEDLFPFLELDPRAALDRTEEYAEVLTIVEGEFVVHLRVIGRLSTILGAFANGMKS